MQAAAGARTSRACRRRPRGPRQALRARQARGRVGAVGFAGGGAGGDPIGEGLGRARSARAVSAPMAGSRPTARARGRWATARPGREIGRRARATLLDRRAVGADRDQLAGRRDQPRRGGARLAADADREPIGEAADRGPDRAEQEGGGAAAGHELRTRRQRALGSADRGRARVDETFGGRRGGVGRQVG
ncbi:MAG: hypothetical protein H6703_01980 [Myxococcales bacterium]|nr:hypothetical protein [Myxococcales bacterium]